MVRESNMYYSMCFNKNEAAIRKQQFDSVFNGEIDTWDYQWVYCVGMNHGLSITPNVNLISNVGFDSNATHTFSPDNRSYLPSYEMIFPLKNPARVVADYSQDYSEYNKHIRRPLLLIFLIRFLKKSGMYDYVYKLKSMINNFIFNLSRG